MNIELYQNAIRNGADIILDISSPSKEIIQTILSTEGISEVTVTIKGMQHRTSDILEMIYLLKTKNRFKLVADFTSQSILKN